MSVSKRSNTDGEIIKNRIINDPKVTKISNKESVDLKDVTLYSVTYIKIKNINNKIIKLNNHTFIYVKNSISLNTTFVPI